jgi:hypothetical protein
VSLRTSAPVPPGIPEFWGLRGCDNPGMTNSQVAAGLASAGAGGRAVPWSSRLASALVGIGAGGIAAFGLMAFVLSAAGGGVGFGDDAESASTPLGLVFGLSLMALGGGLAYLALGVCRGRLLPSLVAFCLATGTAGLGVGDLLLGDTTVSIHELVRGLGGPLVVLTMLITPSHRRYVSLRLRQRTPQRRADQGDVATAAHPLRRGGNVS